MQRQNHRAKMVRLNLAVCVLTAAVAVPFVVCGTEDVAFAQQSAEPKKVLVGTLSGAKTTSARDWILEGLRQDGRFEVVGSEDGAELKTGASESAIAEAALGLEADAVVLGRSRFGKGWSAQLEIYDGKDGSLIEKVDIQGGSFQNYEAALTSGEAYFAVIDRAEGFPPPEPEPVVEEELDLEEDTEEEAPPEEPPPRARPSPLDVTVGLRVYGRAFRYTDTLEQLAPGSFDPLIDYNLGAAPMPFGALHWYPGAHFTSGFAAHLGLTGGYERGVATKVRYADGTEESTFAQSHQLWYAGLRGRIPISVVTLGLGVNYGSHSFALKDTSDGSPTGLFPNVNYSFIEMGGDVELRMGQMIVGAQAGYLAVLGVGEIGSDEWFPSARAKGVHFAGHVGWGPLPWLDLLAGVDGRMYGLNFNPVPADRPPERVAGGATDRYLSAWLGLRFRIPEKSAEVAASAPGGAEPDGGGDSFDDF